MHNELEIARRVRDACIDAAREAYHDAGLQGLCDEGRFEAAVSALQSLNLSGVINQRGADDHPPDD